MLKDKDMLKELLEMLYMNLEEVLHYLKSISVIHTDIDIRQNIS